MNKNGWTLVHEKTGEPVKVGETLTDFRGGTAVCSGGNPPHKPSSSGFVWTGQSPHVKESYASTYGLKWIKDSA